MSERLERVERLREGFGGAARRGGGEPLIDVVEPLAGSPELRSRLAGGAMTTDHIGIEGLRAGWDRVEFDATKRCGGPPGRPEILPAP